MPVEPLDRRPHLVLSETSKTKAFTAHSARQKKQAEFGESLMGLQTRPAWDAVWGKCV